MRKEQARPARPRTRERPRLPSRRHRSFQVGSSAAVTATRSSVVLTRKLSPPETLEIARSVSGVDDTAFAVLRRRKILGSERDRVHTNT